MNRAAERPSLLVIAGPNGSGKTTLKEWLERRGIDFARHINPDEIALALPGDDAVRTRAAQIRADQLRAKYLAERLSFSFETVMSHPSKVAFMRQAKAAGYFVVLYFVGVEDHAISVARVADRVGKGGHDVPTAKIRSRYEGSMRLLADAADTADRVYVFDNSGMGKERRLCAALDERGLKAFSDPMPAWVRRYFVESVVARKTRRPLRSRPHSG